MSNALTLDQGKSWLRIHTFAEGLLARLAHDLEIEACPTGTATHDSATATARLTIARSSLQVVGVVKKGTQLDTSVLSPSDRADIERRIHHDVLAKWPSIIVDVELHERRATLRLLGATFGCDVTVVQSEVGREVTGRVDLSLRRLGLPAVKGPLGAFKLSDRLEVVFRAVFSA